MKYPLILLAVLMAVACSDRERANPLDPRNPVTHGAPTGFQAVANRNIATLTWDPVEVSGLADYHIYRSVGGSSLGIYDTISAARTSLQDLNLNYDWTYAYAVQAVTLTGKSLLSLPDTLIPGPYNFWIADYYNSVVWRISYDGAHVLGREYFYSPVTVAYRPGVGSVWVADYYDRAVYLMDVHFREIERITLTGRPIDIAAESYSGIIRVLQKFPDLIINVSHDGTILGTLETPDDVDINATLVLDDGAGYLWLSNPVSSTSGDIYRCNPSSSRLEWELIGRFAYPRQIAAGYAGRCWVATDSGVVQFYPTGDWTRYLPHFKIEYVSINPVNGDCYYVGRSHQDGQWQTGRLRDSLEPQIILGADYSDLTGIQVLPGEGQAGFLVSQVSTGRILRFDREGNLIGLMPGFYYPLDFALE